MADNIATYVGVGLVGVASVVAIDSLVLASPWVNSTRSRRVLARLAMAGAFAAGAYLIKAPDWVFGGIIAGTVMVTAFDAIVATVPSRRRLDPPEVPSSMIGDPWAPDPPYAISLSRK